MAAEVTTSHGGRDDEEVFVVRTHEGEHAEYVLCHGAKRVKPDYCPPGGGGETVAAIVERQHLLAGRIASGDSCGFKVRTADTQSVRINIDIS